MTESKLKKILSNETNLLHILDNLKEGIIAHDLNRKIFFFNREAERITGYKHEEVVNKDCHEAFGDPFCGEMCLFRSISHDVPDSAEYRVNILTKDGLIRNAEMSVSSIKDEAGKPFGVLAFIKDITEFLRLQIKVDESCGYSNIIGRDPKMLQIFQQIKDLATYDYPVHVSGETGTGKELVAEAIHLASRRAGAPFVPINCGALPEGLIASELFGHVRGSFSGAIRDKKGRFELTDGGTAFLDEVADISKDMQVKLLRFLQTGKFEKVGGEQTVSVNVRIISATNSDLKNEVKKKNFREDLYYRLNVIPIHIPPLRERKTDIPLLVEYYLKQIHSCKDRPPVSISGDAMSLMIDYDWPGNVRQLQNTLQYAIVKSNGRKIYPEHFPLELRILEKIRFRQGPTKKLSIESVKIALLKAGNNKAKAARNLGVGRATLYRFLNEHSGVMVAFP